MHEVLIPHRAQVQPLATIRSTLLQSSLASLRARGHFEAWSEHIDPVQRAEIIESLAPTWMSAHTAIAHYAACDALKLPVSEQVEMGEAVSKRIQGSFLTTLMKTARNAGMNPMILLMQFDRLYERLFQGGSVSLIRIGPKDVDIEVRRMTLTRFLYFRVAFTGVVRAGIAFSGVRASYVKQQSYKATEDTLTLRATWV